MTSLSEAISSKPAQLQGKLWKRERGLFTKTWAEHWFNLEGDKLCNYRDVGQLEYSGFLVISNAGTAVQPTGEVVEALEERPALHCFQVTVQKAGRPHSVTLAAHSKEEMWRWVNGLVKWISHFLHERKKSAASYAAASAERQPHVPRMPRNRAMKALKDSVGSQSMPVMPKSRREASYSSAEESDMKTSGNSVFSGIESEYVSISDCTASYKWTRDELSTHATATAHEEESHCSSGETPGGSEESVSGTAVGAELRGNESDVSSSGGVGRNGESAEETIERLSAELTAAKKKLKEKDRRLHGLRESLKKEAAISDERLHTIEALRQRYFFSLSMAMKLERRLTGQEGQVEVQPLWLQLQKEDIPFHSWPEWLSTQLAQATED